MITEGLIDLLKGALGNGISVCSFGGGVLSHGRIEGGGGGDQHETLGFAYLRMLFQYKASFRLGSFYLPGWLFQR